jgi:hypothetical protein
MQFPEKMLLKLPEGSLGRIDAAAGKGGRSEFVRAAIEVALGAVSLGHLEAAAKAPNDIVKGLPMKAAPGGPRKYEPATKMPVLPKRSEKSARPSSGRWDVDDAAFLEAVGSGPVSSREVMDRLGWLQGRYDRAERAALRGGKVFASGGFLWGVEDG